MSASSKKKLRAENEATKLTERQLAEQKEAKKVKIYTAVFAVVLVALIAVAAFSGINSMISSSGIHEKNTTAVTVGDHKLSNAELSYYYMDALNNFNSNYGSYAYMYGIDTSKPLSQQIADEATGETWAENFINQAAASARAVFALVDAAKAEGFTLPQETKDQIDLMSSNLDAYAALYGYENTDEFIRVQYGNGTNKASYLEYYERNLLASAYQNAHQDSLTFTDAQIQEADQANSAQYSSYNYNYYFLSVNKFLTGGTTDENGNTTYSTEERQAAAAEAETAANSLTAAATVEEFDAAIAALPVNEGTEAKSTAYTNQSYANLNSYLRDWVVDSSRTEGEMTVVPVTSTSTDENGNEVVNTTAYYIAYFGSVNTNEVNTMNVRHILIGFNGETNEDGSYTDEVKAAAKASAEEILASYNSNPTEENFAELANTHSTDSGSNANGGLYEDVFPGQMVAAFDAWCFDAARQPGDTGIVETEYGYHIMYYVGANDQTYRNYLITNDLTNNAMNEWYESLVESMPIVNGDTQYMFKDIVLAK